MKKPEQSTDSACSVPSCSSSVLSCLACRGHHPARQRGISPFPACTHLPGVAHGLDSRSDDLVHHPLSRRRLS
eukprot:1158922-Pelagomonas_calceolata.AAC.1